MSKFKNLKTIKETIRVSGKLKEVVTVKDEKGNIVHKVIQPLMVEFYPRDLMQVLVGASILAIPVAFTEEIWNLGSSLPLFNVLILLFLSFFFISVFVYYNFYRNHLKEHLSEFIKRIISIYFVSFIVVALLMTIIQKAPWTTENLLAVKRIILVTFPASMSATVSDMIK